MTGSAGEPSTPFTMVGATDAMVCDGDVCVVPAAAGVDLDVAGGAAQAVSNDVDPAVASSADPAVAEDVDIEPSAEEAAAASARAITAALDEGASL